MRAAAGFLALLFLFGCRGDGGKAFYEVKREAFVHQIRAEGVLRAAATQKLMVPAGADQVLRLAWLAADGQPVEAGEVVARFERQPIERQLETGRRDLEKAELEGRRGGSENQAERGDLLTARERAELDLGFSRQFRQEDEQVFSRRAIAESAIDGELAAERSDNAAAALGSQEKLAKTRADLIEIARRKAGLQIDGARKGLEALEVKAPHAGIFLRGRFGPNRLEPGVELWPGVPIGELPEAGEMQAEVYVLEADAGGLAAGQEAEVRIDAAPDQVYKARIVRLDAAARPRFRGSPVQYFAVTLAFEPGAGARGKLGQQVSARLFVARRDDALVLPRQAVRQVEGKALVEVERNGQLATVEVKLGPAAAGRVVIEEGLAAGDRVALPGGTEAGGDAAGSGAAGSGAASSGAAGSGGSGAAGEGTR